MVMHWIRRADTPVDGSHEGAAQWNVRDVREHAPEHSGQRLTVAEERVRAASALSVRRVEEHDARAAGQTHLPVRVATEGLQEPA